MILCEPAQSGEHGLSERVSCEPAQPRGLKIISCEPAQPGELGLGLSFLRSWINLLGGSRRFGTTGKT